MAKKTPRPHSDYRASRRNAIKRRRRAALEAKWAAESSIKDWRRVVRSVNIETTAA